MSEPSRNKVHIHSIDFLRGLAAISVGLFHLSNGNPLYLPEGNIIKNIGSFGHLGVEVFFVISGFVIPFSMYQAGYQLKDFKRFLYKRFIRIEPPYVISIAVILIIAYLATTSSLYRGSPLTIDYTGLMLHFGYLNDVAGYDWVAAVYWTLAIEFQFYIIICLIFPLLTKEKGGFYFFCILLLVNMVQLALPLPKCFFNYSLFFTVGIVCFKTFIVKKNFFYYMFLALTILIIGFQYPFPVLLAALFPVPFLLFINVQNKVFKFLGTISYSFYLLHSVIGNKFVNLSENFIHNELARSLTVIAGLMLAVFGCYIYYLVIEKPSKDLSQKIKFKRIDNEAKVIAPENNIVSVKG